MIHGGGDTYYCTGYKFTSPNFLLVVSRSTDGGINWTRQTIASSTNYGYLRALALNPGDPANLFALGYIDNANRLYYTEDGGGTWSERAISGLVGTPYDLVIHPSDPDRMAAATSQGLYATENGGASWIRVTTAFTGAWCVMVQEGTTDLLVGTNANGAWIWENWAGNPYPIGTGMDNVRVNLFVDSPVSTRLFAGTFGSSVWSSYYGTSTGEDPPSSGPASFGLTLHPNPVSSGIVTATFRNPGEGSGRLMVFDLAGRLVIQLSPSAGEHQACLDVSGLAPGVYLTRLEWGGESAGARMVVTP